MTFQYKGYDVHQYTPLFKELIVDITFLNDSEIDINIIENLKCSNVVKTNIISKLTDNKLIDLDLHNNINFIHLLKYLIDNHEELLEETLNEIGNTCIQGITHRLLMLYFSLKDL